MKRALCVSAVVTFMWSAPALAQNMSVPEDTPAASATASEAVDEPVGEHGPATTSMESVEAHPDAIRAETKEISPSPTPSIGGMELPFRLYGFITPRAVASSHGIESFGQSNASAITGAANPVLAFRPNEGRLTFQVQQSRFGVMIGEKKPVRGVVEVDFIDPGFTHSSPTTQAQPRLRIAKVEADAFNKKLLIIAGQDWDLFQPVNHPGLNLVGGAFTAGNTGFMRQQLKLIFTLGQFEVGAAVGLQVANAGAVENNVELSRMPSFAVRAAFLPNSKSKIGVSGIASQLRFNAGSTAPSGDPASDHRTFAGAAGIYGDVSPSSWTNLRFEGYIGQNIQSLGALALSQASAAHDISELGGFVSFRQALASELHWAYGYAGIAHVMNDGVMAAGYTRNANGDAVQTAGIYGIRQNITVHIGYELRPYDNLGIMVEGYWLRTHYKLLASDVGTVNGDAKSAGVEVGMMYTF